MNKYRDTAQVDAERIEWLAEHCTYVGGGSGGTYSFKVPIDSESFYDGLDAAIEKSKGNETYRS